MAVESMEKIVALAKKDEFYSIYWSEYNLVKESFEYSHMKEYSSMSYGWATVFTLAAWFAGLVIDANVRVGDLGLRTVLPVIVMGCCVMKYIKDNSK